MQRLLLPAFSSSNLSAVVVEQYLKLIDALEYDSDSDDKNKNKAAPQSSPISANMMKSDLDLLEKPRGPSRLVPQLSDID